MTCVSFYSQNTDFNYSLAGTSQGLFQIDRKSTYSQPIQLWAGGEVKKILGPYTISDQEGISQTLWYILTSEGIFSTSDMITFNDCNNGLSFKTIKEYNGETKEVSFSKTITDLKDLEVHPEDPRIVVTANKDSVYISKNAGKTWKSLGINARTTGVKAVAVATLAKNPQNAASGETQLIVFMSHPMYGLAWCNPDANKIVWTDMLKGFEVQDSTMSSVDEIADIVSVIHNDKPEIFLSQTFRPRIYRLDWQKKMGVLLWKGVNPADTVDSLMYSKKKLLFVQPEGIQNLDIETGSVQTTTLQQYVHQIETVLVSVDSPYMSSIWIPAYQTNDYGNLSFSELWLLKPNEIRSSYGNTIDKKRALYIPIGQVISLKGLDSFIETMKKNNLNTIVIDMKDDLGTLRYNAQDPLVLQKGYVSRYAIDLEQFVAKLKAENIYLIARVVIFKDKNLSTYAGGKYAVWDKKTNTPWIGTRGMVDVTDETGSVIESSMSFYDENWVDPYSPEVWEYNIAVSKELINRGFDEIQFDYIRFPTDGLNLDNAQYRHQSTGMDKESALMSFLSYARKEIKAPIAIDIYGANGWYRSGARTGQDVELLAKYVDVICPMFYPSHFEQAFMAHAPESERPYRIYYYGSYRNAVIGRNQVLIRPWVQAFYLNVSYDRVYYNEDYVQKQLFAIRDSIDNGYMYWNASGRYTDIRPDIGDMPYKWTAFEADNKFRKPALSGGK